MEEKNEFNQAEYIKEWRKKNMKQVKSEYKADFVNEFKDACKILGLTQSDVFREAMTKVIEKAKVEK